MERILALFLLASSLMGQTYVRGHRFPAMPFEEVTVLGDFPNWGHDIKFGRNPQIDTTSDPEDIWNGGGLYTGQPATCPGEPLEVFSASANDDDGGTGANTLTVQFLDDSLLEVTETLTLDGATGVTTSSNGCRLNRSFVASAGTSLTNDGQITIRNVTTTANVYAQIPANAGQTQILAFTVPSDKEYFVKSVYLQIARASGAAGSATVRMMYKDSNGVLRQIRNYEITTGAPIVRTYSGFKLDGGTDIVMRVQEVSDNGTIAVGEIEYYSIQ